MTSQLPLRWLRRAADQVGLGSQIFEALRPAVAGLGAAVCSRSIWSRRVTRGVRS